MAIVKVKDSRLATATGLMMARDLDSAMPTDSDWERDWARGKG